jgi:hypothetical protein
VRDNDRERMNDMPDAEVVQFIHCWLSSSSSEDEDEDEVEDEDDEDYDWFRSRANKTSTV